MGRKCVIGKIFTKKWFLRTNYVERHYGIRGFPRHRSPNGRRGEKISAGCLDNFSGEYPLVQLVQDRGAGTFPHLPPPPRNIPEIE